MLIFCKNTVAGMEQEAGSQHPAEKVALTCRLSETLYKSHPEHVPGY